MLPAAELVRVSRYNTGEPHFGSSGSNRFDAPGCPAAPEYATCYFGTNLTVAIAETLLHNELPVAGHFPVAPDFIDEHFVLRFTGQPLRLANLTGTHLKRLGGHADLSGTGDYAIPRQWSRAVHDNPGLYDGILYMSRHVNTDTAVVLFDRARGKIALASQSLLSSAAGFAAAAHDLGMVVN